MSEGIDLKELKRRMDGAITAYKNDIASLRTGRASANVLDPVQVEAYGSRVPLNQVANISVPEPRMLSVSVWDKSMVGAVERGQGRAQGADEAAVGGERSPNERQGVTVAQRLLNQAWGDIEHAVAEAALDAGAAVMDLVGMQDDGVATEAVAPGAAIIEGLHARQRQAEGIGVVAVRIIGVAPEERLHALDAIRTGTEPDPVLLRSARSFKTGLAGLR